MMEFWGLWAFAVAVIAGVTLVKDEGSEPLLHVLFFAVPGVIFPILVVEVGASLDEPEFDLRLVLMVTGFYFGFAASVILLLFVLPFVRIIFHR
jgi:hypothetical protein